MMNFSNVRLVKLILLSFLPKKSNFENILVDDAAVLDSYKILIFIFKFVFLGVSVTEVFDLGQLLISFARLRFYLNGLGRPKRVEPKLR